jgi:hypothetical protein
MADVKAVVDAANRLAGKDEESLVLLIGMMEQEIKKNPALKEDAYLEPKYDQTTMGFTDPIQQVGRRILRRWNKELYGLVCDTQARDRQERQQILDALNLGETAVIGAVAAALLAMTVPAPIGAALAPLIVRKFIWPAKDELCKSWAEGIARS